MNIEVFPHDFCKLQPPKLYENVQELYYQARKLFSAEIWKMAECQFWADVMLRWSHVRASRAFPAPKLQVLLVICSKNFSRATFLFSWSLTVISTVHRLKNDNLPFFKFLQKKVSQLVKMAPAHFYPTSGVVICKNHVVRPLHLFKKYKKFLFSSLETFFCRNLENVGMSFLGQCNVEIVWCPGF